MLPWHNAPWQQLQAMRVNLPQALLIHGPRGIGKLELAREFARLILCETPGATLPCGSCAGCRWFDAGQHPDYRQIEPEILAGPVPESEDAPAPSRTTKPSHEIKVDQVRGLTDFLNIGSHRGHRRVAVFHPAESMNLNAANSLLKSLEDPASGACFILVSDNHMRLIPTIRSRCIRLPVGPPDRKSGLAWLHSLGVEDAADWLAFSGGAPVLARELAGSEAGQRYKELIRLLKTGGKAALLQWAANDREQIEALSEVLQKWAYEQVFREFSTQGNFFVDPGSKGRPGTARREAWVRFALEAGRYRVAARHPLNARLFAADLLSKMPE